MFWSLKFINKFGQIGDKDKDESTVGTKDKYKKKYVENKEKIFQSELRGYSCSSSGSSGKIVNISSLFGEPEITYKVERKKRR